MNIIVKYCVFETNQILGSKQNLSLEKVEFKGWQNNSFDTEEEAVKALEQDGLTYQEYLIIKTVNIS